MFRVITGWIKYSDLLNPIEQKYIKSWLTNYYKSNPEMSRKIDLYLGYRSSTNGLYKYCSLFIKNDINNPTQDQFQDHPSPKKQ